MSWLRLTLECQEHKVEALSHLFEQFDAVAISSEAISNEQLYAGVADDPVYWQSTAISALFDDSIDLDILLACCRNRIGTDNIRNSRVEAVADRNWCNAHKTDQGVLVFADRLCIRPAWVESGHDYPATLVLDPGLAFGSGRHSTTSLCLDWLAKEELAYKQVIDYGCGSGILGLSALLLGARTAYAVDIDPQALLAAKTNAANNNLQDKLAIISADEEALPTVDILVANILLNPLIQLAPRLATLVKENGKLVLSGILAVQVEECLAAFTPWFMMTAPVFQEEWALLEGTRLAD